MVFLLLIFFFVINLCLSLTYYDVCFLQPCGHLLGKGFCLLCYIVFCHLPIQCFGSGVVLVCMDCWILPFFLTSYGVPGPLSSDFLK